MLVIVASFLYTLLIYPLIQVLEFCYMLFENIFKTPAVSCIGLSLAVSLICLPLYIVAEKWQEVERKKERAMEKMVRRIKTTFKKNEQYMLLSTYYRQVNYTPLMSLRASFGLLIQIPFFIAAYSFLSNLALLQGESFLFIKDLSRPDAITSFTFLSHSFNINLLPILMTVINIAGGAVYTKGFKTKEKVQLYLMALVFLVLLYDSPAGLVLYWTCNNLFSLVKNLFYKIKNPKRACYILAAASILLLSFYLLFIRKGDAAHRIVLTISLLFLLLIPLLVRLIKTPYTKTFKCLEDNKRALILFLIVCSCLTLLYGAVIPSGLISSSVVEFSNIDNFTSPLAFIFNALVRMAGLFIVWALCIFLLFSPKVKSIIASLFFYLLLISLVDCFIFYGDYPTLDRVLTFASAVNKPTFTVTILNLLAIILIIALPFVVDAIINRRKKKRKGNLFNFLFALSFIIFLSLSLTTLYSMSAIKKEYDKNYRDTAERSVSKKTNKEGEESLQEPITPLYHFTKTGKNVLLLMLDRAEAAYLLPLFHCAPYLYSLYDGFTFYPNTASYNQGTLLAAPALFGGYEYTPLNMNKREGVKLKEKHNEALTLLPRILKEQGGFTATVSDSSWANYSWIPDLSIFSPYSINAFNTERSYTSLWLGEHPDKVTPNITSTLLNRNLFYFSIFRSVPPLFRDSVYNEGTWWNSNEGQTDIIGFLDYYSTLSYMPRLTDFKGEGDQFFAIVNDTTHSGQELPSPSYLLDNEVETVEWQKIVSKYTDKDITEEGDNKVNASTIDGTRAADSFIAAMKLVGRFLQYLKENEAYDNTRIVIVADHGIGSRDALKLYKGERGELKEDYNPDHLNPLLLVKDFNAHGRLQVDNSFMTNADTPHLLLKEVIAHPINPYTKKEIKEVLPQEKEAEGVVLTHIWHPSENSPYKFSVPDSDWYSIKDNIFFLDNWKRLEVKR